MHSTPRPSLPNATWWPSPLLWLVIALHPLALGLWLWNGAAWPWALGLLVAAHATVTAATLTPRTQLLGRNLVRLPAPSRARGEIAITFDDGPDPDVTPALLDLLQARGVHATFFCVGTHAERQPALCREILRRGHDVENHSDRHRHNFALLGPRGYAREIDAAQARLQAACGVRPRLFRAPAGFRNPFLWPVLARRGLLLASWTRRGFDTRCVEPARVLARLTRKLQAGDILLLHDGHAARTVQGVPMLLAVLPGLLDAITAAGLHPVSLRRALGLAAASEATPAAAAMPCSSQPVAAPASTAGCSG